jgi:outer membrane protein assembly factor BamB
MPEQSGWLCFGGDAENSRSNPTEVAISTTNVEQLMPAFDIPAPGVTSTAAAYGGVLYWSDWAGHVYATKLSDHSTLWQYDGSAMGGGFVGSPAVSERFVYVANRNGRVSALDRRTGEERWQSALDAGPHTYIWGSPSLAEADGVLVIGLSNRGTTDDGIPVDEALLRTFHGAIVGIDTATGHTIWRLETSPEPSGAGAGVWSSAAIDRANHLAFIGTGNNFYAPVSALSDSLLAIDYLTGTLAWSVQYTKDDAWTAGSVNNGTNSDVAASPNLFQQGTRALVGVGDKAGYYYVHDRLSGELIWKRFLAGGMYKGGVIAPAALQNNTIYVSSNPLDGYEKGEVFALRAQDGSELWHYDLPAASWGGPAIANGVLYVSTIGGDIFALDATSGEKRWSHHLPQGTGGGFSLVCSTLVIGYGYHDFDFGEEPLSGGLRAFTLGGAASSCPVDRGR